jgi:DNA repair protein RadC
MVQRINLSRQFMMDYQLTRTCYDYKRLARGRTAQGKLLARGPESLSDAELLAIFLRTGTQGKTVVELSRDLLVRFEGLRNLLEADFSQFSQTNGLGPSKFVQIQAALELGKRHLKSTLKSE